MANMSYCRFENTARDLSDCVDAYNTHGMPESESEMRALIRMIQLCEELLSVVNTEDVEDALNVEHCGEEDDSED